jgi:hypothetical protein
MPRHRANIRMTAAGVNAPKPRFSQLPGDGRFAARGAIEEAAVVVIVRVVVAVVAVGLRVTVEGLKTQLDCAGRPEHAVEGTVMMAPKPFTPANVNVVTANTPGVEATMLAGLAEMVKLGPETTVCVRVPVEAP